MATDTDGCFSRSLPPLWQLRCNQGEVVEWLMAPVLKTGDPQGSVGSNPTLSVLTGRASGHPAWFWNSTERSTLSRNQSGPALLRIRGLASENAPAIAVTQA